MKMSSIKTVYDLMRYCRMSLCFQRSIREMKVGDVFILGKYTQPFSYERDKFYIPEPPSDNDEVFAVAEAWIEKERGAYYFYGTWTFPTKPRRSFIMTFGEFKIRKGGVIEFVDKDDSVKSFALVCRYLAYLLKKMPLKEKEVYFKNKSHPLFNGIWLDSDYNERKVRAIEVEGKIKPLWVNYKDYMPTHQISAIIDAGFATGALQLEEPSMSDIMEN